MTRRDIGKRLAAIEARISPTGSIAARIKQLSPAQQATVQTWQKACRDHAARYPGEGAYALQLDGYSGPRLPRDIEAILFDVSCILETATGAQAARIYQEALR